MSNFYTWMFSSGSIVMDESRHIYRRHPDGTPCYAKNENDCPLIQHHNKAEEADNINIRNENQESTNIKNTKVTKEEDDEYLDAVNRGDTTTCSKMVLEIASRLMPNTKAIDENGNPQILFKGSAGMWNEFNPYKGRGFFTPNESVASKFNDSDDNKGIRRFFVNLISPVVIDGEGKSISEIPVDKSIVDKFNLEEEKKKHYSYEIKKDKEYQYHAETIRDAIFNKFIKGKTDADGIILKNVSEHPWNYERHTNDNIVCTDIIPFVPSKLKLADPITYDDNGKVIPLSKRFDMSNTDNRY